MTAASDSKYRTAPLKIPDGEDTDRDRAEGAVKLTPPPRFAPLGQTTPGAPSPPGRRRWRWATGVGIVLSIVAIVVVFVGLPAWVDRAPSTASGASVPTAQPSTTQSGVANADVSAVVDSATAITRRMEGLEEREVGAWGGAPWSEANRLVTAGERSLEGGDKGAAVSAFAEVETILAALEGEAESVLRRVLDDGHVALATGDTEAARRAFDFAKQVEPGNPEAATGLARCEVHDRVFDLLVAAEEHERNGDHQRAAEAARGALASDPSSSRARKILARSRSRLSDASYAAAMSAGLIALEAERFDEARQAFARAATLRPGTPETTDGLTRAEAGLHRMAISKLRSSARALEEAESWQQAAAAYDELLELDETLTFAKEGGARCRAHAVLAARIDAHLARPERLSTDAVFEDAADLVDEAREVRPQGPVHARRVEELAELVAAAASKIEVVLYSDGLTEVLVHQVARLGTFESRRLELRPGTYVVVGSRDGYRDVRLQLEIRAHQAAEPLSVLCTEELPR